MAGNIFGGDDKQKTEVKEKVDTHSKAILTVVERQKDLESSLDLFDEKLELLDHNSIKNFKKLFNELNDIKSDMRDLKHDIKRIDEFNSKITKQLKLMTTKDEVIKLEKYIDLWNPMNFATRDEVEDLREKIRDDLIEIIEGFLKE